MTPVAPLGIAAPPPAEVPPYAPTYSVAGDAEYERNERWNRLLDRDNNRRVRIEGKDFRPSWVLFCMDRPTYLARVEALKEERKAKIERTVIHKFPTPIAHNFDRFVNGFKDQKERLEHLRNTWEATISLLFALIVGEARLRGMSFQGLKIRRKDNEQPVYYKHILTDSLAMRLDVTKAIIEHAVAMGVTLSVAEHVPIATIERIRNLNQVRNNLAHRSSISATQARALAEGCQDEVLEILADLKGLQEVCLIRYLQNVGAEMTYERFRGAGLLRHIKNVHLPAADKAYCDRYCKAEGRTLALIGGTTPISLQPFICCRERDSGQLTRVCFFKQMSSYDDVQFEDLTESELVSIETDTYQDDINELRAMFGLAPIQAATV